MSCLSGWHAGERAERRGRHPLYLAEYGCLHSTHPTGGGEGGSLARIQHAAEDGDLRNMRKGADSVGCSCAHGVQVPCHKVT